MATDTYYSLKAENSKVDLGILQAKLSTPMGVEDFTNLCVDYSGSISDGFSKEELPYLIKAIKKNLKKHKKFDCFAICDRVSRTINKDTPKTHICIAIDGKIKEIEVLDYHNTYNISMIMTRKQAKEAVRQLKLIVEKKTYAVPYTTYDRTLSTVCLTIYTKPDEGVEVTL